MYFGLLNDAAVWALRGLDHAAYWQQWVFALVGIGLVGCGVACAVVADLVMIPADALVLVVTRELNRLYGARKYLVFGYAKVVFDVALVASTAVLSLLFLGGLCGVREGTIAAALLIGLVAKQATTVLLPLNNRWHPQA